jgi:polyhydroxybutyrate depolymerase
MQSRALGVLVLAFHGTADPMVPYAGGAYFSGDAVAKWAAFDGCGTRATTTTVAADVERVLYPDCRGSAALELYRVLGGGHTWPGASAVSTARLGPTTTSIERPL